MGLIPFIPSTLYLLFLLRLLRIERQKEFRSMVNRAWRDDRGNALLGSLVAMMILSVACAALVQLMGVLHRQNASVQSLSMQRSLVDNVRSTLRNQAACDHTVKALPSIPSDIPASISIFYASGAPMLQLAQRLEYNTQVTGLNIVTLGYAVGETQLVSLDQNGNSANYKMITVLSGNTVKQARITLDIKDLNTDRTRSHEFLVNLNYDNNGILIGCIM
jgi:hypothetical protein